MLSFLRACVRPALTLLFGGAVVAGFFVGLLNADQFLGVAGLVIGYYYGSRQQR